MTRPSFVPSAAFALLLVLLAPHRARAGDLDLAVALEGGAAFTHSRSVYEHLDDPSQPDGVDTLTHWGPAGALEIALTWRAHGLLRLGGAARVGLAGAPANAFTDRTETQVSFAVGPALRLEPDGASAGLYGGVWVGFAAVASHGIGWAAGLDAGYRFRLAEGWSLGAGASLATCWAFDGEDGDFGRYDYLQRSVWPSLHVRLTHPL